MADPESPQKEAKVDPEHEEQSDEKKETIETTENPQGSPETAEHTDIQKDEPLGGNTNDETNKSKEKGSTESTKDEANKEPEEMDVLGNGKLLKKVLQAGKGRETRPTHGDQITVTFSAALADGTLVEKSDTLTFVLGDGDYLQAFDLCCSLMELDERARVTTDANYAYGEIGRKPDIPPNAKLVYEIHLETVHGLMDYASMSVADRLREADKKRERGNFHYSRTEYSGAINSYSKAINVLDDQGQSQNEEPSELQKLVDMRLKCYNNLAAAQLKVEIYDAAVKSCDSVLRIQPHNVKALFRKGKCLAAQGEIKDAIVAMKKALKYEPESKIIHSELSRLTNRQKVQEERERAMYQRMMGQNSKNNNKQPSTGWSYWAWAAGVAGTAIAVSIGFTAYRYLHM